MKNYGLLLLVMLLVGAGPLSAWEDFVFEEDELDLFSGNVELTHVERNPLLVTAQSVLNIIAAPPILLQDRLVQDFYKFTHGPFLTRSLLDEPWALLSQCPCDQCWHWNTWYFYNQTTEANYTKNGKNISSYLNLTEALLFDGIEQLGLNIDIPTVFELIGNLRMQERRTGFMFGACKGIDCWWFEWKTPIYYLERNFHLTNDEQRRIKAALLFDDDDSDETTEAELHKHVISDQVGLGDTRLNLAYNVIDNEEVSLDVGGLMTLPTAFAFSKGLMGSNFKRNSQAPLFDILELFRLVLCFNDVSGAIEMVRHFVEAAFDKLSANLLQTSLGNNGHVGLGLFTYVYAPISERVYAEARLEGEYLLPKGETRFFIKQKDPQVFASLEPYTTDEGADPAQAPEKLVFLNQQLVEAFIPFVFVTNIFPGFIVKACAAVRGDFGRNWEWGIGGDLWWQTAEKFGKISTDAVTRAMLKTDIAKRPQAYQNKLFASVTYARPAQRFDWRLMLYGDYTVLSSGIGQDFNLVAKIALDL